MAEQQQVLTGTSQGASSLDDVHPRRGQYGRKQPRAVASGRPKAQAPPAGKMCTRCGKGRHSHDKCPTKEATCYRCQKKGHYSSQFFSKQVSEVASENHLETAFLDTVSADQPSSWQVRIRLNACETTFKLDTGAEVTAITEKTYKSLKQPQLTTTSKILHGPSQQQLKTIGQFWGTFFHKNKEVKQLTYVVEGLKTNLLGLPAITALELAVRVDSATEPTTDIQHRYPSIFQGLGNLGEEFGICLKPGAVPRSLFAPKHVPLPLRPKVEEELNRMESIGVISRVDEPTPWCAGMVVVPKKDGKISICVDLKPLNENVLREVHPLLKVDETLAQLSGAKVFSKLDANSGFWQIPLAKDSRLLTTFITPFGRYCFNKMPFGISSAPEHFQKRMSQLLTGLHGVLCLMDDVLVFRKDEKEHSDRLDAALKRIEMAGVTLNPSKCEFGKDLLKFLGHLIDEQGIQADPEKTSGMREMKPPSNVPELRRFLGMVNQLGKFSSNLADLTRPLRELLGKKSTWLWDTAQDQAFSSIKAELSKPTVLALYNPQAPTKISADASSYGLGAVLMQEHKATWKPIAYASRSMTGTERWYAQIEKEALAATWACEKFSTYVLGMKFLIETDHKPLVPLLGTKHLDSLPP